MARKARDIRSKGRMGRQCCLCGKEIPHGALGEHFRTEHPEYRYTLSRTGGPSAKTHGCYYYCGTCNRNLGGFLDLVDHYQRIHPELVSVHPEKTIEPNEELAREGQSAPASLDALSLENIDALLKQVDENMRLLEETREKNRELHEKCTRYAVRIVELQNEIAREVKSFRQA